MSHRLERLYELLPVVYHLRDRDEGEPLHALLRVIAEQVDLVEDDIARLYENWFIETCEDWVVPYIGELIGYQPVHEAGEPGDPAGPDRARNKILIPRREVANTIRSRRRRGALALLEELARDTAGWPARAVEFYRLLGWTQALNFQRPDRGRTVDVRDLDALDRLGGPFDSLAHTVNVRRLASPRAPRGLHNLPGVGLFVWRLKSYPITHCQAYSLEEMGPQCYTFSALGNDSPLYVKPKPEVLPTDIAGELNVPTPIRRRAFEQPLPAPAGPVRTRASELYYGLEPDGTARSLVIWAPEWPTRATAGRRGEPVPATRIIPADLSAWQYRPPKGYIAVDPELGRIAFPPGQLPKKGVRVSYHYGFSADMGGGEYDRPVETAPDALLIPVSPSRSGIRQTDRLADALHVWEQERDKHPAAPFHAIIEIQDSDVYVPKLRRIELYPGHTLEIRAAYRKRPVIRLLDYTEGPDLFTVALSPGSTLILDGLLINGRGVHLEQREEPAAENGDETEPTEEQDAEGVVDAWAAGQEDVLPAPLPSPRGRAQVLIRHCTLVPGWSLLNNCEPRRPAEPSLQLYYVDVELKIEHSILGSIQVQMDEVAADPVSISVSDSVLDATGSSCDGPECEALGGLDSTFAHAVLAITRCTVFGKVMTHAIQLAENSIFGDVVRVVRSQIGCMRFCYVDHHLEGSRTPRRYSCQPDLVERTAEDRLREEAAGPVSPADLEAVQLSERLRVHPRFNSTRYATPRYCQLAESCAVEIVRGASDQSEMGVFHDLYQPQRVANLLTRLDEYTPAAMHTGIIFAS